PSDGVPVEGEVGEHEAALPPGQLGAVEPQVPVLHPQATQQPHPDRPRQAPDPFQRPTNRRFVVCHRCQERPRPGSSTAPADACSAATRTTTSSPPPSSTPVKRTAWSSPATR